MSSVVPSENPFYSIPKEEPNPFHDRIPYAKAIYIPNQYPPPPPIEERSSASICCESLCICCCMNLFWSYCWPCYCFIRQFSTS